MSFSCYRTFLTYLFTLYFQFLFLVIHIFLQYISLSIIYVQSHSQCLPLFSIHEICQFTFATFTFTINRPFSSLTLYFHTYIFHIHLHFASLYTSHPFARFVICWSSYHLQTPLGAASPRFRRYSLRPVQRTPAYSFVCSRFPPSNNVCPPCRQHAFYFSGFTSAATCFTFLPAIPLVRPFELSLI